MSTRQQSARFVLAPVIDGVAAWPHGIDLVLAPIRLTAPVPVTLAGTPRPARGGTR